MFLWGEGIHLVNLFLWFVLGWFFLILDWCHILMSRLVKELKNAENLGILLKMQARSWTWAHSPLSVLTTAQYTLQCPILHVFLGVVTQLTLTPEYSTPNVQTSAWRMGRRSLESTSELHVAYFIPAGCKYPLPFCPSACGPNQWLVITWIRTVLGFLLVFC